MYTKNTMQIRYSDEKIKIEAALARIEKREQKLREQHVTHIADTEIFCSMCDKWNKLSNTIFHQRWYYIAEPYDEHHEEDSGYIQCVSCNH